MSAAPIRTAADLAAITPGTAVSGRLDTVGDALLIVWGRVGSATLAQWATLHNRPDFTPDEGPKPAGPPFLLIPEPVLEGQDGGLQCRIVGGSMAGRWITVTDPAGRYQARDQASNSVEIMAQAALGRWHQLNDVQTVSDELLAVQHAKRMVADAEQTLRVAVVAAVEAGAAVSDVATASGVGRQTVYRWLGRWERD